MLVIFVGDKPSAKNVDSKRAFVGTQSYKRLLDWIWQLNLSVNDVLIYNRSDMAKIRTIVDTRMTGFTIIALGKEVAEALDIENIKYFKLPHPSGLNRQLNNKKFMTKHLQWCRKYIDDCKNDRRGGSLSIVDREKRVNRIRS